MNETPVLDYLRERKHWTQNVGARDKNGDICSLDSEQAYSFCLYGAIKHYYKGNWINIWDKVYDILKDMDFKHNPVNFNDDNRTTHEMVVKVLEKAQI